MNTPLIVIHVVVSIFIIFIVLLQVGRGAEAGALFGGTGQAYASRGRSTFVGKLTTVLAVMFMLTSMILTYTTSTRSKSSVIEKITQEEVIVDDSMAAEEEIAVEVEAAEAAETSETSGN